MARSRFTICLLAIAALCMAATPASAQSGSIFRDEPPRPPADVPSAPPSNAPQPPPYYPNQRSPGGFKFERKHHLTTLERMVRWQEIAYD